MASHSEAPSTDGIDTAAVSEMKRVLLLDNCGHALGECQCAANRAAVTLDLLRFELTRAQQEIERLRSPGGAGTKSVSEHVRHLIAHWKENGTLIGAEGIMDCIVADAAASLSGGAPADDPTRLLGYRIEVKDGIGTSSFALSTLECKPADMDREGKEGPTPEQVVAALAARCDWLVKELYKAHGYSKTPGSAPEPSGLHPLQVQRYRWEVDHAADGPYRMPDPDGEWCLYADVARSVPEPAEKP